jgi:hypothetical protein
MAPYKLYYLGSHDEPQECRDLACESDAEAINALHDRDDGRPMELWQSGRKILRWPGRPSRRQTRN